MSCPGVPTRRVARLHTERVDDAFNERIFKDIDARKIRAALDEGIEATGVPRIRIHDLRHSHVSLLIDMGYSAVAIAERTGQESIEITYRYAHLMPDTQDKMGFRHL